MPMLSSFNEPFAIANPTPIAGKSAASIAQSAKKAALLLYPSGVPLASNFDTSGSGAAGQ